MFFNVIMFWKNYSELQLLISKNDRKLPISVIYL